MHSPFTRPRQGSGVRRSLIAIAITAAASSAFAQPAREAQPAPAQHQHTTAGSAMTLFPPREASGTAWLPDWTPMYAAHRQLGGWSLMFHGQAFAQFFYESGGDHRRSHQAGSINWIMAMARRQAGSGRFGLRLMASVEPWTLSGCGYPNLLATGETCDGDTIHDRQHPHDLFMEIAADYDRPITPTIRWQIYAGLSGEPALGPPGFPHRLSAFPNPVAPIAHHWLDSTHISFGVVTTGLYSRRWKAEMSVFNGREPDEDRADVDLAALDSISGRLTYLPNERLALQVSAAHLNDAEVEFAPNPRTDVNRATASATYHRGVRGDGIWATTLAYGVNSERGIIPGGVLDELTHAVMLESSLTTGERHTWFGRFEVVGKPAHDLHAHEYIMDVFAIGKLQGGYVRHLKPWKGLQTGIGATGSASLLPPELAPHYNGRVAPGFGVFVTVRPARHVLSVELQNSRPTPM
jgi:hypothetical protein